MVRGFVNAILLFSFLTGCNDIDTSFVGDWKDLRVLETTSGPSEGGTRGVIAYHFQNGSLVAPIYQSASMHGAFQVQLGNQIHGGDDSESDIPENRTQVREIYFGTEKVQFFQIDVASQKVYLTVPKGKGVVPVYVKETSVLRGEQEELIYINDFQYSDTESTDSAAVSVPAPKIFSINPGTAIPGQDIVLLGEHFQNGADVLIAGTIVTTTFISSNVLIATVPTGTPNGATDVTVVNPVGNPNTFTLAGGLQVVPSLPPQDPTPLPSSSLSITRFEPKVLTQGISSPVIVFGNLIGVKEIIFEGQSSNEIYTIQESAIAFLPGLGAKFQSPAFLESEWVNVTFKTANESIIKQLFVNPPITVLNLESKFASSASQPTINTQYIDGINLDLVEWATLKINGITLSCNGLKTDATTPSIRIYCDFTLPAGFQVGSYSAIFTAVGANQTVTYSQTIDVLEDDSNICWSTGGGLAPLPRLRGMVARQCKF